MLMSFTSSTAKSSMRSVRSASKARMSGMSEVRARRRKLRAMLRASCRAMADEHARESVFLLLGELANHAEVD